MPHNINDKFFAGSYKHAWKGISPEGLTLAETDFIMELAALREGSLVLDMLCGYGRHSIELARRGMRVTAIDNLPDYISEIRQAAESEQLPINAQVENAASMNLDQAYDAVICMGNSFSFFDRATTFQIIRNISAHLKPGGKMFINSWMIAEIAIRYFREKDWHYAGDYKCMLEYEFMFDPTRIESEQTIISNNGEIEVVQGIDYIYTLNELDAMFSEAGLQTIARYSTPRKRKFSLGDTQIYIVVNKIR